MEYNGLLMMDGQGRLVEGIRIPRTHVCYLANVSRQLCTIFAAHPTSLYGPLIRSAFGQRERQNASECRYLRLKPELLWILWLFGNGGFFFIYFHKNI